MARDSSRSLFPWKDRQAPKRRCRPLPWQTFLSLEPLEHRLMLDGMSLMGSGNHPDHPDPTPAHIGDIQPSGSQNPKGDGLPNDASGGGNAAASSAQNATNGISANVETAALQSNPDPAANVSPGAANSPAASAPAVNADAATVHFAQLGNDATPPSNTSIEVSYPEVSRQGIVPAELPGNGLPRNGHFDNVVGEPISSSQAFVPQKITSPSQPAIQPLDDGSALPERAGVQLASVQPAEAQPQTTMPPIADPVSGGMESSGIPVNGIASAGLPSSPKPLAAGDEAMLSHGAQFEAAPVRNVQPATAAISARSLTPQSGFVDMIFASVGQDTAKGLKSLSHEPLDPWILRGVVIQPGNPTPQAQDPSRSGTSPQPGSRSARGNSR